MSLGADERVFQVLLVEDSPSDAELTRKAFSRLRLPSVLHHVHDGVECMAYLERPSATQPRPDLILLDLNMPRMDGRAVLREIKKSPDLVSIPVVVLTTSADGTDVVEAYRSHSNAYIVKPVDLNQFFDVIADLERFWFRVATLAD
ncbi:MAG: response regulator [Planctomyces sp.]|nr:response regulator [Planctomyces sp.]